MTFVLCLLKFETISFQPVVNVKHLDMMLDRGLRDHCGISISPTGQVLL